VLAGKVVDKESLHKARAKSKVRGRRAGGGRGVRAPRETVPLTPAPVPRPPQLLAEIKIHRSISHRNIVGFETFFEDNTNVYMMLEVCPNQVRRSGGRARGRRTGGAGAARGGGGAARATRLNHSFSPFPPPRQTLMEFVKRRRRLTEPEAALLCLQLLDTMRYLHANGVIHRDLKLGNLFVGADMELRVGDFGLAAQLAEVGERKRTVCGTPNYIAPEILDGAVHGGHSFEVDVWAFGVILYTLVVGRPPFETADVKSTYKRIRENAYAFPDDVPLSAAVVDLVRRILVPRPADRPSLEEIARHAFFSAPGVMIPKALPVSALTAPPRFAPDELQPGAAAAAAIFSRPIAGLLMRMPDGTRSQCAAPTWGRPAAAAQPPPLPLAPRDANARGAAAAAAAAAYAAAGDCGAAAAPPPPAATARPPPLALPLPAPLGAAPPPASGASPAFRPWEETLLRASASAGGAPPSSAGSDGARAGAFYVPPAPPRGADKENAGGWGGAAKAGGAPLAAVRAPAPAGAAAASLASQSGASRSSLAAADVGAYALGGGAGGGGGGGGSDSGSAAGAPTPTADAAGGAGGAPWLAALHTTGGTSASTAPSLADAGGFGGGGGARPTSSGGFTAASGTTASLPAVDGRRSAASSASAASAAALGEVPAGAARVAAPPPPPTVAALRAAAAAEPPASPPPPAAPPAGAAAVGALAAAFRRVALAPAEAPPAAAAAAPAPAPASPAPAGALNESLRALHGALSAAILGGTMRGGGGAPRGSPGGLALAPARLRVSAAPAGGAGGGGALRGAAAGVPPPAQWVTTWVDYSAKYGLGYLLSSGVVGVYFNDSTKLVLEAGAGERIEYADRVPPGGEAPPRVIATLADYPPELKKKVTLLRHFREHLLAQYARRAGAPGGAGGAGAPTAFGAAASSAGGGAATCAPLVPVTDEEAAAMAAGRAAPPPPPGALPLVKKWVRSRRAVLFRLAGGAGVQAAFYDGTSLMFEPGGARVAAFDADGRRAVFAIAPLLDAAGAAAARAAAAPAALAAAGVATLAELDDLALRVRYARDIMAQVLTVAPPPPA
jgi:serine/threonine protein kinase